MPTGRHMAPARSSARAAKNASVRRVVALVLAEFSAVCVFGMCGVVQPADSSAQGVEQSARQRPLTYQAQGTQRKPRTREAPKRLRKGGKRPGNSSGNGVRDEAHQTPPVRSTTTAPQRTRNYNHRTTVRIAGFATVVKDGEFERDLDSPR